MNKTKEWAKQKIVLKELFERKGITSCEIGLTGCWRDNALGWAHRHKRHWYNSDDSGLVDFNQVILACNPCHGQIEYDRKLTEEVFERLRGEE